MEELGKVHYKGHEIAFFKNGAGITYVIPSADSLMNSDPGLLGEIKSIAERYCADFVQKMRGNANRTGTVNMNNDDLTKVTQQSMMGSAATNSSIQHSNDNNNIGNSTTKPMPLIQPIANNSFTPRLIPQPGLMPSLPKMTPQQQHQMQLQYQQHLQNQYHQQQQLQQQLQQQQQQQQQQNKRKRSSGAGSSIPQQSNTNGTVAPVPTHPSSLQQQQQQQYYQQPKRTSDDVAHCQIITKRFRDLLAHDRNKIERPDLSKFRDMEDVVERLLAYHLFQYHEETEDEKREREERESVELGELRVF